MAENFPKPQQKIEAIEEITPRHPVDAIKDIENMSSPEKVTFTQALDRVDLARTDIEMRKVQIEDAAQSVQKPSPIDIARESHRVQDVSPTTETVLGNATELKKGFQAPQAYLMSYQEKSIEIPKEFATQMNSRIEHMDKSLIDVKKISSGIQVESAVQPSSSPTVKFLHFLTDADRRLDTIVRDINVSTSMGAKLTPEKLLSVQIKLNYVQQEMEFFTNILNRSIESVKTLMNVQI